MLKVDGSGTGVAAFAECLPTILNVYVVISSTKAVFDPPADKKLV
jgi:hypothetical protein